MYSHEVEGARMPKRWGIGVIVGLAVAMLAGVGSYAAVANPSADTAVAATGAPAGTQAGAMPAAAARSGNAQAAATPAPTPTASVTPTPADILDVSFASGAPVDHAQGLPATTVGHPQVAEDATLGAEAATFNGTAGTTDAYYFPFTDQWPKMLNGFSFECVFRYNPTGTTAPGFQGVCSDTNGGGAGLGISNGKLEFEVGVNQSGTTAYNTTVDETPLVAGRWYDAVGAWNRTYNSLYVDGNLVAHNEPGETFVEPDAGARIFPLGADAQDGPSVQFPGQVSIAYARVFSHGLTGDEAKADAEAYNLLEPPASISAPDVDATVNKTATFTATLSDKYMTGLVSFQYNGVDILCQAVVSNATATCTAPRLPPKGTYDVEVRYSGDFYYGPMSTDLTLTVQPGKSAALPLIRN